MMRPVDRLWIGRKMIVAIGDTILFAAAVAIVFGIRDPNGINAGVIGAFLPVLTFQVLTAYAAGLYELRVMRDFVALVGGLLGTGVACMVFGTTYFYVLSPYLRFSPKVTLLLITLGSHAGMLVWRRAILSATGFRLVDLKILILGQEDHGAVLRGPAGRRSSTDYEVVGDVEPGVGLVVVDRRWTARYPEEAKRMLAAAVAHRIPMVTINEFHESVLGKVSSEHAGDLAWALDHVLPRVGSPYFTTKRVLDVAMSGVLLVLLGPALLLIALAIWLADRERPFYGQMRVGYLGRPFLLWKFRTMRRDADEQGPFIQFADRDPRINRFGSVLRRLRIDELPQLWNVLRGDMSIVGPRPEWIKEVEILEKAVPTYSLRYLVPPGLTGWAQVYFRKTNSPQDSVEKHNYDLYYLKHFSLALDISIMLKTMKRVAAKELRDPAVVDHGLPSVRTQSEIGVDIASIVGRG